MRKCRDFMATYMEYTSNSEAPDQFHRWTCVSTVAGVLRRRVWIDQKSFQWTPNFYVVLVAPPGIISKSTTQSLGIRLLRKVRDIYIGSDSTTWQALAQQLGERTQHMLFNGEYWPMSCVTLSISELGTLLNTDDREMIDVMVDLWDGRIGPWTKTTKTQGEDVIENPWINMIGCTTPAWIASNMNTTAMSGGFMSRCLFVFGDEKRKLIPYPALEAVPHYKELMEDLVNDLEHIANVMRGPFELTKDAIAWGMQWYAEHHMADHSHLMFNAKTSGYLARKQTHFHKLAMVLAAMRGDDMIITEEILADAAKMVTELEANMSKVFKNVESRNGSNFPMLTVQIIERISAKGKVDRTELYRQMFDEFQIQLHDFNKIIDNAIAAETIHQLKLGKKIMLCKGPLHSLAIAPG